MNSMHTGDFDGRETVATRSLRLFSIYTDFPASFRARWATGRITQLAGQDWRSSTEMWTLDLLNANTSVKRMILEGAANADVLVIAISSLEHRKTRLMQWLDALAAGKNNRTTPRLFIGLLGDEENKTCELEWTVKQFIACAQKLNRDFIWHWMGQNSMDECDWLTECAETLLSRKQLAQDEAYSQEAAIYG